MTEDTQSLIRSAIVEALEIDDAMASKFKFDTKLFVPEPEGLGLDSISALEIVGSLSLRFQLPFDDVSNEDLWSVDSLASYVESHLPRPPSGEGLP